MSISLFHESFRFLMNETCWEVVHVWDAAPSSYRLAAADTTGTVRFVGVPQRSIAVHLTATARHEA
jgi:hypothetical protein